MKRLKLITVVVIAVSFGVAFSDRAAVGQDSRRWMEFVGMSVPFLERAGTDDGLAFAIQFGGDTHGSLDTCG